MNKYMHSIYQQIIRFGITGFINTAIDFTLFNLLLITTGFSLPGQIAVINAISVMVAATNSYLMNRYWTFAAAKPVASMQVGRFLITTAIGLLINTAVVTGISGLAAWLPFPSYLLFNIGKLVGAVFGASWNFMIYRTWVFVDQLPPIDKCTIKETSIPGLTSVIIPAYNEALRLPVRLQQLLPWLLEGNLELVIVDDGSEDNTFAIAEGYAANYPGSLQVIKHQLNRGKGAAVQSGMAVARGEFLIFSDADTTFSPDHLKDIHQHLKAGKNLVIGCRRGRSGQRLAGEGKLRQIMGRGFNLLVQALVLPGITDSQCGLKGFSRLAAVNIFSRQRIPGFAFDVEILALAQRLGYSVKVIEVAADECEGSSVKCWRAAINMGLELLHIRWNLSRNYYGLPRTVSGFSWQLAGGVFLAALAVRLPWLWEVPRYIDELSEVNLAYSIYQGKALPLTNMAHDIGSMHNYILAAIFKLLGPSIYWPRLYIAVTSALTVVLVYTIGRRMFGRPVGMLAAGLLLTNGMHIVVTHMAWSNSSTPFFFTLAWLSILNAEEKGSGWWLLIGSLLWAATLQSHSSAIIYVLMVAVYLLSLKLKHQTTINWSWYWGGISVFLIGYSNMIYYNLISRGGSIAWVGHKTYALESNPSITTYLNNTTQMGIELLRSLGSIYVNPVSGGVWPILWMIAILLLLIMGLYKGIKAGKTLPALIILAGFLIIPWLNQRYTFYLATRYIMPIIICSQIYLAVGLVWLGSTLASWAVSQLNRYPWPLASGLGQRWHQLGSWRVTFSYGLIIMLLSLQLIPFYQYCNRLTPTNESNRMALSILNLIARSGVEKSLVVLDKSLPLENQPLPYLLKLSRQPYVAIDGEKSEVNWLELQKKYPQAVIYAIMSAPSYARLAKGKTPLQVHELRTRVAIPSPSRKPRHVYVLRLTNP